MHARKIENMQICSWKCSAGVRKTRSKKSFSGVSRREHRIREAASQIDLRNQSTICKNVSCSREIMAESVDGVPAKPSPVKRRRFQTFKKAYHEKWPFITVDKEDDTCVNSEVCGTVVN